MILCAELVVNHLTPIARMTTTGVFKQVIVTDKGRDSWE